MLSPWNVNNHCGMCPFLIYCTGIFGTLWIFLLLLLMYVDPFLSHKQPLIIFRVNFAPGTSAVLSIQWLSMYEGGLGGRAVTEWELPFNGLPLSQPAWSPMHTHSGAHPTSKEVHIHARTHTFWNGGSFRQVLLMLSSCNKNKSAH